MVVLGREGAVSYLVKPRLVKTKKREFRNLQLGAVGANEVGELKVLLYMAKGLRIKAHSLASRVPGSGLRVQGSGFRVHSSGFGIPGSGFRVQSSGFRVQSSGFRVQGSGFIVQGSGFRVPGAWFSAQGSGFRLKGLGLCSTPPSLLCPPRRGGCDTGAVWRGLRLVRG